MAIRQRLEIRQTTQLVMTPQLRQAIRLLQMSNLDLAGFLADEVERNPLLALEEAQPPPAAPKAEPEPALPERLEDRLRDAQPGSTEADLDTPRDALYDEAAADAQRGWTATGGPGGQHGDLDMADLLSPPTTLREHLLAQIGMVPAPAPASALARLLVDELEEDGYLRAADGELCARHGAGPGLLDAALAILRGCEPAGIAARNLADCLALQLAERDRLDPAMQALLANLDLLAAGKLSRLCEIAGVDREDLADMIAEIRDLNPRPGSAFANDDLRSVIPDILLRRGALGDWIVELNPESLPRLIVDGAYAARVPVRDGAAKSFLAECRTNASWLQRTLDQRARTIVKVAAEIVRRQSRFFEEGVSGLRPMTLRDIADEVGMHESTVSRVTAGKYMACDRGLIELRFFFSTALAASDGGEALSSTAIRDMIRRLIDAEEPRRPLSDDTIVEKLRETGVDIARRTVAKYREAMRIPSSVQRRRAGAALERGGTTRGGPG
jgi:RNA polymerase sigma-54 factor